MTADYTFNYRQYFPKCSKNSKDIPGEDSFSIECKEIASMCCSLSIGRNDDRPLKSFVGVSTGSNLTIGLFSHHFFGACAEHFGANTMIAMAPANMAAQSNQKAMKRNHLSLIQNGSLAYFINSALPIPERDCLTVSISILASPFSEINLT